MEVYVQGEDDTKSVIKAFIRTEPTENIFDTTASTISKQSNSSIKSNIRTVPRIHDQHMRILKSPLFESYGPKIMDSIFTLEKFPLQVAIESRNEVKNNQNNNCDDSDSQSLIPILKSATGPLQRSLSKEIFLDKDRGFYFTTFESVLIVINIILICGVGTTLFMYIKLFLW